MKLKLAAAATCGLFLLSAPAFSAEVKVLASGAVKEAANELFPQFEKVSANKIAVWAGTVDIKKRIAAGEVYDLVIVASPELDAFMKDGKFVTGSKVDLVRSSVGVAVKPGSPKPVLNSGEDLKSALLAAKSVGYSTGPSGAYMQKLFEKMGIAEEIKAKAKAKAKVTTPGVPVASLIRDGSAEIGFQQVSELIHEAGIDFIGPIPADVQQITVFSSAVPTGAKAQMEAKALQKFLTAPASAPTIKKHGLERIARTPSAS